MIKLKHTENSEKDVSKMKIGLTNRKEIINILGLEKGLQTIKKAGFDAVDFKVGDYFDDENHPLNKASEDEFLSFFHNIKRICDDLELEISQTHGASLVCVPDSGLTERINRRVELDIKATAALGVKYCVFHSVRKQDWEFISTAPEFLHSKNVEFFQNVVSPVCGKYDVNFAMETHGLTIMSTGAETDFIGDAYVLKENFDMIKSDYKAFCLDTGHINEIVRLGTPTVPETVKILGKDIKVLHLHDNEGYNDSHLPPLIYGKRNINWQETFDALDEIGFDGVYNFELLLARYGTHLEECISFLGKFLREFTEEKGRLRKQSI